MAKQPRVWDGSQWQELAVQVPDMSNYAYLPTTPVSGFRNAIINGDFRIWQRGTNFTASGNYTADRWQIAFVGTGTAMTTSQLGLTAGNPIPNYEPQYALRCAVTGGSGTSSLAVIVQKIEDVRTFAGQTVTLSFWAKAASGTPGLGFDFFQEFGSGGSTTVGGIGATKWTLSTSWTRYSMTVNLPSISGKTIGAGSLLAFRFWFSSGSDYNSLNNSLGIQSPTIDIWGVQLEAGSVATPFEQRPIGTELALCQRYFQKSFSQGVTPANGANSTSFATGEGIFAFNSSNITEGGYLPFIVEMRVAPTITIYGNSSGQAKYLTSPTGNTTAWSASAFSAALISTRGAALTQQVVNQNIISVQTHWTASAEL